MNPHRPEIQTALSANFLEKKDLNSEKEVFTNPLLTAVFPFLLPLILGVFFLTWFSKEKAPEIPCSFTQKFVRQDSPQISEKDFLGDALEGGGKRGEGNLTKDTPPKKGFWTPPPHTVRFPIPPRVIAFLEFSFLKRLKNEIHASKTRWA